MLVSVMRGRFMRACVRVKVHITIKVGYYTLGIGKMMRKVVKGNYMTLFKVYRILGASHIIYIMDKGA